MIKIAIFTPKHSYEYMNDALKNEHLECQKQYYFYDELTQLESLYSDVKNKVHGIITSGPIGYEVLKKSVEITTPIYYFDIQKYEFYKILLELFFKNKQIDFSRICIDFIDTKEMKLLLEEIIPSAETPLTFKLDYSDLYLYKDYKKIYLKLMEEKKIDLVLTRMSNITSFLSENKIPYKFIFPSKKSLGESFENILKDIKINLNEGKKIVIGKIKTSRDPSEIKIFFKEKFKDFIIYELENNLEIFTLKETFTRHMDSLLSLYKQEIFIGWGGGDSLLETRYYAEIALKKHINSNGELFYYLEKENETILSQTLKKEKIDPKLYNIFQQVNIDKEKGDKLLELFRKKEDLTAENLGNYLHMSKRNASRILLKLEANHMAISKIEKISRGRPVKLFKLEFNI